MGANYAVPHLIAKTIMKKATDWVAFLISKSRNGLGRFIDDLHKALNSFD